MAEEEEEKRSAKKTPWYEEKKNRKWIYLGVGLSVLAILLMIYFNNQQQQQQSAAALPSTSGALPVGGAYYTGVSPATSDYYPVAGVSGTSTGTTGTPVTTGMGNPVIPTAPSGGSGTPTSPPPTTTPGGGAPTTNPGGAPPTGSPINLGAFVQTIFPAPRGTAGMSNNFWVNVEGQPNQTLQQAALYTAKWPGASGQGDWQTLLNYRNNYQIFSQIAQETNQALNQNLIIPQGTKFSV
jgi:hypothetical protein